MRRRVRRYSDVADFQESIASAKAFLARRYLPRRALHVSALYKRREAHDDAPLVALQHLQPANGNHRGLNKRPDARQVRLNTGARREHSGQHDLQALAAARLQRRPGIPGRASGAEPLSTLQLRRTQGTASGSPRRACTWPQAARLRRRARMADAASHRARQPAQTVPTCESQAPVSKRRRRS